MSAPNASLRVAVRAAGDFRGSLDKLAASLAAAAPVLRALVEQTLKAAYRALRTMRLRFLMQGLVP